MKEQKAKPFGLRDKFGYAMGDFGCELSYAMVSSYLLVFYTKVIGIEAGIIGTMFMLARFVDAFTDVGMGHICDTKTDKNGDHFRPWLKRLCIPLAILSCLLYNPFISGLPMAARIAYMFIVYVLYASFGYTGVNIPYGAMSAVITNKPDERASLSTWRTMAATLAGIILGVMIPMVVYTKNSDGNEIVNGPRFLMLAVIFGILSVICFMICHAWSIERIHPEKKNEEHVNIFSNMKEIIKDKAVITAVLGAICVKASTIAYAALNQYLFLDYFGDTGLLPLASIIMMLGMFLMAPFVKKLTQKFGKKECSLVGMIICAGSYVVMYVLHVSTPVQYLIGTLVAYVGMSFYSIVGWAIINDCIDNHAVETRKRVDGTVYGMFSFLRKLADAVTGSIAAWALTWIGYESTAVVQTEAVKNSIYNITLLIPLVFFICSVICLVIYPLNKKKVDENTEILRKMEKGNERGE